ncbi:unnamed protein product [Prunus armeniaca]
MMNEFDMTDLGLMHYFLGIEVVQSAAGNFICQKKYVLKVLERFYMMSCNPVGTPTEIGLKLTRDLNGERIYNTYFKQIVGSLMYLTSIRLDIMHAVSMISRYMDNPTEMHLKATKRIFRYLKGTSNFGILYKKGEKPSFFGFNDSDYAGAISWSSKKQQLVTLSTTEVEFVVAASCSCQAIRLRRMLEVLVHQQQGPTTIFCDNVSAIKLSRNLVMHGRQTYRCSLSLLA